MSSCNCWSRSRRTGHAARARSRSWGSEMKPTANNAGRAGALAALPEGAPVVVLVGRANAGKSTLFNRIARGRRAIVSPVAGTTRDLNVGQAEHRGRNFFVVDSG